MLQEKLCWWLIRYHGVRLHARKMTSTHVECYIAAVTEGLPASP